MENRFKILEIIDKHVDIENYTAPPINASNTYIQSRFDIHDKINKELKEKGLIGEHQNIYFTFNMNGKIDNIHLQLNTRADENDGSITERFDDCDGNEITVTRRPYKDPMEVYEATNFQLNLDELKNYKRTKLIDRMLDG